MVVNTKAIDIALYTFASIDWIHVLGNIRKYGEENMFVPKVSVIVPVYNVEKYLQKCLESILEQTLEDIEIICIDDGSTDNSGKILDRYAAQDRRVKVIHRRNAGYGAAMNAGLDIAQGKYVGIVESDDCIKPKMYQALYNAAVEDDLDVVKSDAMYWIEHIGYLREIHNHNLKDYYDRVLYDEDRNIFFDFFMNIWTGIYKRKFINEKKIRFHESLGASYQDNGFWMQTLLYCKRIKWISQAFYLYRQDNPAASVKSQSKILAMTKEYEFLEQILRDRKDYHLLPYCYYYKLFRHRGTFMRIADEYKREFCGQIKKDYAIYKGYIKGNVWLDNWIRKAAVESDKVCDEIRNRKQMVKNKLESSAEIIIYGAGRHGNIILRGLYNEGYYDKICCFATSQIPVNEQIAGKKVMMITNAHQLYPDALVIVAVIRNSGMYCQMVDNLISLGISNYMDGTFIEECYYIL